MTKLLLIRIGFVAAIGLAAAGCSKQEPPGAAQPTSGPSEPAQTKAPAPVPVAEPAAEVKADRPKADSPAEEPAAHPLAGQAEYPGFEGKRIGVVSTANVMGDIDACGCRTNPQGGLARKAAWLQSVRAGWDAVLVVDAGDLFHARAQLDAADRQMVLDRAQVYVDAYAAMGHDAQGIGDRDLALGLPALRELMAKAPYPFVSANVLDATTQQPAFRPHVLIDKAGLRIGLFGLTGAGASGVPADADYTIAPPVEVARQQVAALSQAGAQVVVALAHLPLDALEDLADQVPGIDLIVGSDSARELDYPLAVGTTYITDAYSQGKRVAVATLLVRDADATAADVRLKDPNRKVALTEQVAALDRRIEERQAALAKVQAKGEGGGNVDWLQQSLAKVRAERAQARMELEELGDADPAKSSFVAFDFVGMDLALPEDDAILSKTEALKLKYPQLKVELTDEEEGKTGKTDGASEGSSPE